MCAAEGVLAGAYGMKEMTPGKPVGLTQPQLHRRADRTRYVGAERGAKLREFELPWTCAAKEAGFRQEAKNLIKRRRRVFVFAAKSSLCFGPLDSKSGIPRSTATYSA